MLAGRARGMNDWTVALALRNADLLHDRVFALPSHLSGEHSPYTPWRWVRDRLAEHGLPLVTADRVLDGAADPRRTLVISYDWLPLTRELLARGARPAILTSLEPPVIAWELYAHLRAISRRFSHTFLFGGAQRHVSRRTRFHQVFYPQVQVTAERAARPWAERAPLAAILSNKALARSPARWRDRPREVSVKREAAALLYPSIGRDLYQERMRGVAYFARRGELDLYGQGWGARHPAVGQDVHAAALRAYRGLAHGKLDVLARYRFALALENCVYPGYVSEKLFDCLFAGCVPIYLGAPDVERYVPPAAFVDLRRFRSYADLRAYLFDMRESEWQAHMEAGQAFLRSEQFRLFSVETFARHVVEAVQDVARQRHPG